MPQQVFCEHCGGLVYSTATVPSLAKRCTCNAKHGFHHPGDSTIITKVCVGCGHDVSHERRMKDGHGKYWCISCGEADQTRRHASQQNCADCNMVWPLDTMKLLDGMHLCEGCYLGRMKSRENLKRSSAQKWLRMYLGIGVGAAALLGAMFWIIKIH